MIAYSVILISAPRDYEQTDFPLVFSPDGISSREECLNIQIIADDVVENLEIFRVFINSSDPSVVVVNDTSPVSIVDSSGKKWL